MRRIMKAGMSGQGTIVLACNTTPYLVAYRWSNDGFGAQMLLSPAAPGLVYASEFTPDGEYVVGAHGGTTPYISAWPITHAAGFGTKVADPNTAVTASPISVAVSPDGNYIIAGASGTPYIQAYEWSGTGFGLKFAGPATAGGASGSVVAWHPDGNAIAYSIGVSPYINAWKWSSLGFGTKYANPSATAASCDGLEFSPTGGALVAVFDGSPYVHAYPFTYAGGFSAKMANPGTLPAGNAQSLAFNNAGTAVAVGHITTPFVSIYAWSDAGGFGAKFADPGTLPTGSAVMGIKFLPGDKVVLLSLLSSPYVEAYEWDNVTGFGAKFDPPADLPPGYCTTVDFYPV